MHTLRTATARGRAPNARRARGFHWHASPVPRLAVLLGILLSLPTGACGIRSGWGMSHEAKEAEALAEGGALTKLVVNNRVGDVEVIADASATQVTAEVVKTGRGPTQADAEEALEEISVSLEAVGGSPGVIEARVDHPEGSSRHGYSVSWRITAPTGLAIEVHNGVGDVKAEGFTGGAVVVSGVGDVTISGQAGGAQATTDVGDADISASGPIQVRTRVGGARVHVLPGAPEPISVRTDVGDLELRLPEGRSSSAIVAEADVGSVSMNTDGKHKVRGRGASDRFSGKLGDGSGPPIALSTNVGNLTVRTTNHRGE